MNGTRQLYIRFAVIVVVWYLITTLPQSFVDTCADGVCDLGGLIATILLPMIAVVFTIIVEMRLYNETFTGALDHLGITRFQGQTVILALIITLPLLLYYPVVALLTGSSLSLLNGWPAVLLVIFLYNGINEETMFRGFIFRHLREGNTFWRGALLAMIYFALAHVPLIFLQGPVIGIVATIVSIPAAFLTAYLYERGNNTIWGSAVLHTITNLLPSIVVLSAADIQPVIALVYLVVLIIIGAIFMIQARRGKLFASA